MADCWKILMPT